MMIDPWECCVLVSYTFFSLVFLESFFFVTFYNENVLKLFS